MHEATHASFFSGVGGLDLGLERAGWRTVSFSEIDPYANMVLGQRWRGVPNLGDITQLASGDDGHEGRLRSCGAADAHLWSGGFPCQDLSVAGKRRGMVEGTRSNLAFAFLALVERHRPPAILLENVPGLLSSHGGRDMAALLGAMVELGYGVAYRTLDARHFGVPQRRRRVFIVGLRSDPDDADGHLAAERAAAVLAVGTRCRRHPATGHEAGEEPAYGAASSPEGIVGQAVSAKWYKQAGGPAGDEHHNLIAFGPSPDPDGVRAPDGLARRLDDCGGVAAFVKAGRAQSADDDESWREGDVMPTLNGFDVGDARTTAAIIGGPPEDDDGLPLGLDSHRYRCCGNGVVSSVAEWIGLRLAQELL